MIRRLNVPVDDVARFAQLSAKRRPLGMTASKPTWHLLRETYFDTSDNALAARSMTLKARAEARGHGTLELSISQSVNLQGIVEEQVFETPVVGGLYETLAGPSEVAARIREAVDPAALRPKAAVDIDRETRELRAAPFGRATHRIVFDEVIAHTSDVTRELHEVTLVEVTSGKTTLEELGDRLRDRFAITSDGLDTFRRIQRTLVAAEGAPRAEVPNDVRVSLMIVRDWEVALVEGPDGLVFPNARGSGEDIAREYLADFVAGGGGARADLDLVGFATARRGGADLEVWLHEHVTDGEPEGVTWIPLVELLQRLGAPRLRDPRLISTLLMLVRSEMGQRLLREAPHRNAIPVDLPLERREEGVKTGKGVDDYLDLELSILDFNQRVLELAEDDALPLLERIRFLSIFSSNMDEFFVVRVGRLKDEVSKGGEGEEEDFSPEQLLDIVAVRVRSLMAREYTRLYRGLLPALAQAGVRVVGWDDLDDEQRRALRERFSSEIFPVLTPLSLTPGPGRSFPRLTSLGLGLAIALRRGEDRRQELGYLPIPGDLDRFCLVPGSKDVIPVEDVIGANAGELFTAAEVVGWYPFRATRLGDVAIDEDSSGSLLSAVADEVEARPYMPVIRVEVADSMPRELRATLSQAIRDDQVNDAATLTRSDLYMVPGLVDPTDLAELCDLDVPDGLFPPYEAERPLDPERSIFDTLAEGDVLCHHPFHDFESTVGRFLRDAAADPDVVAIKLTLYRTGRRSPIMDALIAALDAGKEVSVFVELKARFDEESNIHWTNTLKDRGARVVYGVVGYKTHAKTALVVRREDGGVRRYVHIGTGNYNAATARFYTDLGLISADPDLGADLNDFFNELTGGAGPPQKEFRRLLVAPNSLVQGIKRMIDREIDHAKAGRPARIQVKVNGLADRKVVKRLYKAAQAGVKIDLIVRSICTLRPDVPELSEGIRVVSILGRFLEHSRIFYFENAGQSEYYIGSADWRARNLRRRVEVVTPVDDPGARAVLRALLDAQLEDPRAWELRGDGAYERLRGDGLDSQHQMMASGGGVPVPI
ncbi:MAG: polyphosphate kinase 1 [Gemmatimonadota bacterium]